MIASISYRYDAPVSVQKRFYSHCHLHVADWSLLLVPAMANRVLLVAPMVNAQL